MSGGETVVLRGMGVSDGVGVGRAVCLETRVTEIYRIPLPPEEVEKEVERVDAAVDRAVEELEANRDKMRTLLGEELAGIFDAHALLMRDQGFRGRIVERIRSERVNAEWAVHKTAEELGERFAGLDEPHLSERGEDLQDVSRHLLRVLRGFAHHALSEIVGDVVIVADDLTPSDAVRLGRERVVGFVVETGGRTSHTTIIARSLNLPLVGGVAGVTQLVTDEDPVIVDGGAGEVILHPSADLLERYRRRTEEIARHQADLAATRELASTSRDGVTIELMANVDLPEEIEEAKRLGARGVGLYRSEFLYIEKSPELPSEEDHVALYTRLITSMHPDPVVIRTFDLGGRKLAREVMETHEDNPVLGLRGIRLTLARPEIFRTQLRALFRAGVAGDLWILLPLVSAVEEIRDFRSFADRVMAELEKEGVPFERHYRLGVMIEVPAAAVIAGHLAREVDFFAIGSNDLIQYALAVDRNNEHVAYLNRPLHPAILRMIRWIVEAAEQAGIDVSICGEMAAGRRFAPILIGLGLRRLSMSPRLVPEIKACIRELSVCDLERLARECLDLATSDEVESRLEEALTGSPGSAEAEGGER